MQVCNTSRADRSLAEGNDFFALLKKVTLGLLGLRITGHDYVQLVLYGANNMNMISTGALLTEVETPNQRDALVKKLVSS